MNWRDETGQTVTEYLMISGLMIMVANFIMKWMQHPFQKVLQDIVNYMINDVGTPPRW